MSRKNHIEDPDWFLKKIKLHSNENYRTRFIYSYVQYSNVAAKMVRRCLKPDLKTEAAKRDVVSVKFTKWEGGKPVGES